MTRQPAEIWQEAAEEGERRLRRSSSGLLATGTLGGIDVMLGVMAMTVVSGAVATVTNEDLAHVVGSLFFGIGLVIVIVGRSELFTENFLVPLAAVARRRPGPGSLVRLWAVTMLGNVIGLLLFALILTRAGLVPPETLDAAGTLADTFAVRELLGAFLSAIVAGVTMTLLTWLAEAVDQSIARVVIAMLIGFLLVAPSLNHAVVALGEMSFGVLAGTAHDATWVDIAQNLPVAIAGNVIGGMLFVTLVRALQVQGEPGEQS